MPTSSIQHDGSIDKRDVAAVVDGFRKASTFGLEYEYIEWLLYGLKQGMAPSEAAREALTEWDM